MAKEKTFDEILGMVTNACRENFYLGLKEVREEKLLDCATEIYIAQMRKDVDNGE
jgi:hypothetical protein